MLAINAPVAELLGAGIFGGVGTILIVLGWSRVFSALGKGQTRSG